MRSTAAYWKEENAAFDARPFFDPRRTPYILHEAEVEQGGRIIKDGTFFLFGWMYQNIPLGSYLQASVPTPKMRAGDFSELPTAVLKDPYNNNAPLPNDQIPANRFSSVSQTIMTKYYRCPTSPGTRSPITTAGCTPSTRNYTRGTGPSSASITS